MNLEFSIALQNLARMRLLLRPVDIIINMKTDWRQKRTHTYQDQYNERKETVLRLKLDFALLNSHLATVNIRFIFSHNMFIILMR